MSEELPTGNTPPLSLLRRIDEICDRFEHAWIKGEQPLIEAYLTDVEVSEQVPLLGALLDVELEYRAKAKQEIRLEHYEKRFAPYPDLLLVIERRIDDLRKVGRVQSPQHQRFARKNVGQRTESGVTGL